MTIKEKLFELLAENRGSWLSGEWIAGQLYVSRNAVWKAVGALRKEGYQIDAVTRRGYRLAESDTVFSSLSVLAGLDRALRERLSIQVVESTGSTNRDIKALAEEGVGEGRVVIAKEQTAGKGRLGRSFSSPKDTGLYMSILLRPRFPAEEALFITTTAAVAVSEAIDALTGAESKIKWVNDVYLNGRKVCGILTEAAVDFEGGGLNYAVCGIGVNLSAEKLPKELENIAGGILNEDRELRGALAAEILTRFFFYYDRLPSLDFLSEYRRRSLLIGREIGFIRNGTEYGGTAVDIDERARLVVRLPSGELIALSSGEATLKKGELIK
ncbi:MAG: biotin--[acetyl-CoA-carboxylase] ligase [Bacteroides sp.]|nr:biotin--[acetyl-CoA-carboxylase] ligase [Eubacterium sp.]MCM1419409.1 biotin--[acetyl-CoA-carboxylase] ligase [Roseburia sp.]MCM1463004.1 biotin--[acetyl-CoA-carboxylase] ligase [Bacteroides sp.]